MASETFKYIWRYTINPAHKKAFLAAYNAEGEWVQLFRRDPTYVKTLLLQDAEDENRYMTIDTWKSRADRDAFRIRYSADFESLDRKCEAFTEEEHFIGDYQIVAKTRD